MTRLCSFILLFSLLGCYTSNSSSKDMDSSQLGVEETFNEPRLKYANISKDSSMVFYKIPLDFVLSTKNPKTKQYEYKINIKLSAGQTNKAKNFVHLKDTIIFKSLENEAKNEVLEGYLKFPLRDADNYFICFSVNNMGHKQQWGNTEIISKKPSISSCDEFIISDTLNNVSYCNLAPVNSEFILSKTRKDALDDSIFISKYSFKEQYPLPIFDEQRVDSIEKFVQDTFYVIKSGEKLLISQRGMYVVRNRRDERTGFCFLVQGDGKPDIKNQSELVETLYYLSNDKDYNFVSLSNSMLVDEESLEKTEQSLLSTENIIKSWYKRAEYANNTYSSHIKGWKTDRGMITMLYGRPMIIYHTKYAQRWVYGKSVSGHMVDFIFTRSENSFSENDYKLVRASNKKMIWNDAILSWKNGIVYDNKEIIKKQDEYDKRQQNRQGSTIWY